MESMEKRNRGAIILFSAVCLLYWMVQMSVAPYLSPYMKALGAASSLTGLMLGAFGLPQLILRLPLGIVTDRTSQYKLYIVIGNAIGMVALLGMYLSTNPWVLVLMRLLSGITTATWVCYTVMYGGYFSRTASMRTAGHVSAFLYAGQVIGYLVSLAAVLIWDIRSMFLVMFLFSVLCFVLSLFIKDNGIKVDRPPITWAAVKKVLTNKNLWLISLIGFFQQFLTFAISNGFLPSYTPSVGVSETVFTIMSVGSVGAACVASLYLSKPLLKWLGGKGSMIFCAVCCVIYCLAIPLCKGPLAIVLVRVIFGLVHGAMFTLTIALSIKDIPYERQAASAGFYYSLSSGGGFVGPVVCGLIGEAVPLSTAFVIVGLICAIGVVLALFLSKDENAPATQQG